MKLNHRNKTSKFSLRYLLLCYILLIVAAIIGIYVFAAAGNICGSGSPCICGAQCNSGGESGNGYNTIDDCADEWTGNEWVQDITITDLDGSIFTGGHTVEIKGYIKCDTYPDGIAFAYTNGSGWKNVYDSGICNSGGYEYFYKNITLEDVAGTHSIRAMIYWSSTIINGITCGSDNSNYGADTDDISFEVVAASGSELIVQSLDNPENGSAKAFTLIDFNFTAAANNQIDNCSLFTDDSGWSAKKTVYNVQNNTITNITMNLSEGSYIWNVYCYDNESNIDGYDINYTANVDLTRPGISITSPKNDSYQNSSTLTVDVNHSDTNPDSLILNINGTNETVQAYSGSTSQIAKSGLSEGAYTYFVYANDSAGNINSSKTKTVNIDLTNPFAFDLSSPPDNEHAVSNADLSPLFEWGSTTENNFANYTLQISTDNTFAAVNHTRYICNNISNSSYQFDGSLTNNNSWYWRIIAYDLAGNYRISTNTFTYITNTSDLIVNLVGPANNFANNSGIITFSYIPQGSDLDSCSLWGNFSGTWKENQTNSTVAASTLDVFDPLDLSDGKYIWNVRCNNTGGSGVFSLNNYTLYIDTIPPIINFSSPTPQNNSNQSSTTAIISITHTESYPHTLILDWNGTNESYSYSGTYTNITKSGLSDGTYTYYVWINDTAGNVNQTGTRIITIDSTPPQITGENITPYSGTNLTTFNITANVSDAFSIISLAQVSYPNGTKQNFSMYNNGNVWYYEFNSPVEGIYNLTIFANDSLGNSNVSNRIQFIIDLSPPGYQDISELEDPLSGNKAQIITINVSDALTNVESVLIFYNGSNHTMALASTGLYNHTWEVNNLGTKYYSFFMNDSVGNWNYTPTFNFTINDTILPNIKNITYTPASLDDIDPNRTINVTANVSDRYGISAAILQYKETNASEWNNGTMRNSSGLFVGNFTPDTENNWIFRIWANDSSGNINVSANTTIEAFYDWTWNRTPAAFIPQGAQPSQVVTLGTLTINNTGDYALRFDLSNPANQPAVGYNETEPFDVAAGSTKSIIVSAVAPGLDGQYEIDITIDAANSSAVPSSSLTETTIVVSSDTSANLFAYIYEYDASVEQGQIGINLTSRIMNVGGAAAYNITSNWTIPSDFITRNSLNMSFSSLAAGESVYHSLIVSVLPDAELTSSARIEVRANSGSGSYSSDIKYISINKPGTSSTPVTPGGGGSGGGESSTGGGGGIGGIVRYAAPDYKLSIVAPDEIEVMRGTKKSFVVEVINDRSGTLLDNIELEIKGFKTGYITIQPDIKRSISYGSIKKFMVVIDIPGYMKESRHELELLVTANGKEMNEAASKTGSYKSIKDSKRINLIIHEVSEEDIICLYEFEESMDDMEEKNFNIIVFKKIINKAKLAKYSKDYKKVKEFCNELKVLQENAYDAYNGILFLKDTINKSREEGYDTGIAERILELAIGAFERGNFNRAVERLKEAELSISVQKSIEQFARVRNFLKEHWLLSIAALILLSGSGIIAHKSTESSRISTKIRDLKAGEEAIMNSIRQTQTNYFIDRIIGTGLYKSYMDKYRKRIAEIHYKLIELRMKQSALLKKEKNDALRSEAKELMNIMEDLQIKYYEKRLIDKEAYRKMFYEFKKRHVEVKQKLEKIGLDIEEKENVPMKIITDPMLFFYMHNEKFIKSLDELYNALKDIDNDTFTWHVNEEKNDFSKWIEHVFENKGLAEDIANEKTKEGIINVLDIYLSKFQNERTK
ncbi:MAG: hypothetical protein KAK00_00765 [Nanoarchaeota archaeon]|nr:hypothetical protein [Nanoarchaeota archaeon]